MWEDDEVYEDRLKDSSYWRTRAERAEAALREIAALDGTSVDSVYTNYIIALEIADKALEGLGRKDAEG